MSNFDQTAIAVSNGTSYVGIGTTVISGLSLSEWGVIVGMVFWVLGFIGSQFWSWRRDKRERLEQQQRMRYRERAFDELDAGQWATWQDPIDDNSKERGSNE